MQVLTRHPDIHKKVYDSSSQFQGVFTMQTVHVCCWIHLKSEMNTGEFGAGYHEFSISRKIESSERFWIIRPVCSVIEQNVQPPKQPRIMLTENLIISNAGKRASPYAGMRQTCIWQIKYIIHFSVVSGIRGGLIQTSRHHDVEPKHCITGWFQRYKIRFACA